MDKTELKSQLIRHENVVLTVYICTGGARTIGCGRNIDAHPLPADMQAYLDEHGHITEEMAFQLLDEDIERTIKEARTFDWYPELSDGRKMVIVDMIFNMGLPVFKGFKRTIALISQGSFQSASIEMLNSAWAGQVGDRAKTLSKMMRHG